MVCDQLGGHMRNFFPVNRKKSVRGLVGQLSLAGFGIVFFRLRSVFFQVNRKKDARGLAQTIISGPIRGRFFQVTGRFFQVTAARQRDFTLRGRPEPRDGLPVGAPRGLSRARFGCVFFRLRSRFFQVNRKKTEPGWRDNYLSTESGTFFFRLSVFFQVNRKKVSHMTFNHVGNIIDRK